LPIRKTIEKVVARKGVTAAPEQAEDSRTEKAPQKQRVFEGWITGYLRKLDAASKPPQHD